MERNSIPEIYNRLLERFGPQYWWPGDSRLEIVVGAILTQNTNWKNVEKAIANLKAAALLDCGRLIDIPQEELAPLIRPAGYFNVKAKRLKAFFRWLCERFDGDLEAAGELSAEALREELLSVSGIGPETADSIILYGFEKPVFVVDAYTARILVRHLLITPPVDYQTIQELFESALPRETSLYNEYHALLVRLGKEYCRTRPICSGCPLEALPHEIEEY